ncbi:MAG: ribonuclease HII [Candidatus Binatia bacterium]
MRGRQGLLHPSFLEVGKLEEQGYSRGFRCIAGLDEVGRGTWAGPVVAAAVVLPRGISHPEIKDSKLLTPRKREALTLWIKERAVTWGLGVVDSEKIDRMNILNASLLAMAHAFSQLKPVPDYLLIDGAHKIPLDFLKGEGGRKEPKGEGQQARDANLDPNAFGLTAHALPFQRAIKKGDRLCLSIAAASIVAKAARDQMMREYDEIYPEYGFGQHKGYGSPLHLAALSRYGPSPIHRRSFKPVRRYLTDVDGVAPASLFRQG